MSETSVQTLASGSLNVELEEIGEFTVEMANGSLANYASQAYAVLTGEIVHDVGDFFQLISYDAKSKKAVFRIN